MDDEDFKSQGSIDFQPSPKEERSNTEINNSPDSDEDDSKKRQIESLRKRKNNSHHSISVSDDGFDTRSFEMSKRSRHTFGDFRDNPSLIRTKSIIYIVLSLIGVIYAVTTFIMSIEAYQQIGKKPLALSSLIVNWETKMISDIMVVKGQDVCPTGFHPMFERLWQGSSPGCYCKG